MNNTLGLSQQGIEMKIMLNLKSLAKPIISFLSSCKKQAFL